MSNKVINICKALVLVLLMMCCGSVEAQIRNTILGFTLNQTTLSEVKESLKQQHIKFKVENQELKIKSCEKIEFGGFYWDHITLSFSNDVFTYIRLFECNSPYVSTSTTDVKTKYDLIKNTLEAKYSNYRVSQDGNKIYYLDENNNSVILDAVFNGKIPYMMLVYMYFQKDNKLENDL